ncbi:MAG: hypothetical protein U5L95_05195 [Candidatus Saccharibacteria bacterium]|nr:hypothetical protein [Candidatus Saccharibacteria bacterium]
MGVYKSKYGQLPGTDLKELTKLARAKYHAIQKRSPRRAPYVRSKYFTKDKIFINNLGAPKSKIAKRTYQTPKAICMCY